MNVIVCGRECGDRGYDEFEKGILFKDAANNLVLFEVDADGVMHMIAFWHQWGWDWANYTTPDGVAHAINNS